MGLPRVTESGIVDRQAVDPAAVRRIDCDMAGDRGSHISQPIGSTDDLQTWQVWGLIMRNLTDGRRTWGRDVEHRAFYDHHRLNQPATVLVDHSQRLGNSNPTKMLYISTS